MKTLPRNHRHIAEVAVSLRCSPAWPCLVASLILLAPIAHASVPVNRASSSGAGVSLELSLASLPVVNELNLGSSSGNAPPAYAPEPAGANLNVGSAIPGLIAATGTLSSTVQSSVDGLPGSRTTSASGTVNGLNLTLADPPLLPALLTLGGNTSVIRSQCQVEGSSLNSTTTGSATLTNVNLTVLGQAVVLPANPAANTVLSAAGGVAGLTIYLNEQSPVAGSEETEIRCTAIRIKLESVSVAGIGVISGEIKAGLSSARQFSDTDGDGLPNGSDSDSDGDGIPDAMEMTHAPASGDSDGNGIPNFLDLDSDNDGINDVIEGGGSDVDGNGLQDGSIDVDQDGLVDSADPDRGGTALPVPDSDGDTARDYLDLDSDNDTVSDLLEGGSGGKDANHDGMVDGGEADGDGIRDEVDSLPVFGDAGDPGPANTDGTDSPDYLDPDSDNSGGKDIETAGRGDLDDNGDGRVDGPFTDPDGDGVNLAVDTIPDAFGGTGGCRTSGIQWKRLHFNPAELNDPALSSWTADPDQDGVSNALEYVLGTNPRVHSPPLDILLSFDASTGFTLSLARDACSHAFIGVEYSTDLANWVSSGPGIDYVSDTPTSLIARVTGNISGGGNVPLPNNLFVRLRVTIP